MDAGDAKTATPWHAIDAAEAAARCDVDVAHGLDATVWRERQRRHGPNVVGEQPSRSAGRIVLAQLGSPLVAILVVAAVLALALGHQGDAAVILVVVVANAIVGALQEGRAERSMAALRRLAALHVTVRRAGVASTVPARELVPGDILLLAAGDAVGADARLVEQSGLHVAQASLTGESTPVAKSLRRVPEATALADRHDMVHAGTHVTAGRGVAVVVATGPDTEVGRIAALTQAAREPATPLEARIRRFGRMLTVAALGLFVLVVVLGRWRQLPTADLLMVAIGQMVSMVPEGLPVAMTIALAVGMQRMASRGAIIRRLAAVETLGSTTVICTDKTGTLTRNEMTVRALWVADGALARQEIAVAGTGYRPVGGFTTAAGDADAADPALSDLLGCAALCNDARLRPPAGPSDAWTIQGDPTEAALLVAAVKAGIDLHALRRSAPREGELPFDAGAQLMATRHRLADATHRVVVKGSPEAVLRLCGTGAQAAPGDETVRAAADAMAARALRVLAVAVVDDGQLDPVRGFEPLVGRALLLGLVGQIDPPREEARPAVAACRRAGIRPVMVTGDHRLTGLAIAREIGIAGEGDRAVDGTELERMGEVELRDQLPRIAVFARVHPAQKLRIVVALQARGDVVAMTGDGVNDAPALARADVGVAMGITGTEVAKSAAKVVITDDDFATIVGAVEQGRVVYANLRKVILFLFATSVDEVAVLLLALLGGYPLPLAAVQILWINIVTEGTLTVNLAMDPPDGDELRRRPVPREAALVDRGMLMRIAVMASTAVAVTFGWFVWRSAQGVPIELLRTETFTVLAMCQWFNVLSCQSASRSALGLGVLRNRWLLGGLLLSVLLQGAVLYLPLLNGMFHTQPLPPDTLLLMVAAASLVLWAEEARKRLRRLRG